MKAIHILTIVTCTCSTLVGQTVKETADRLYSSGEWLKAVEAYKEYLRDNKGDYSALYNLANSLQQSGDCHSALGYYEKSLQKSQNPNREYFNMAKCLVQTGESEEALTLLEKAAANGLQVLWQLSNDPEFEPVRGHARFAGIIERARLNAYPCLGDPNFRKFDFWLGDWDVFVRGRKVGENSITSAEGGCAIHENWKSTGNHTGQSINYFDPTDQKWHQNWVGSGADIKHYIQSASGDGMLQFIAESIPYGGAQKILNRMTFTHHSGDGTVRQYIETSSDGGSTWTPGFDGLYRRK